MKLRFIQHNKKLYFCCTNGSIKIPTENDLINLITSFKSAYAIKGEDGYWSTTIANMEDVPGETLAYVDKTNTLHILSEKAFSVFKNTKVNYISATEYAKLHGKCRASVKNMCVAGRIKGAIKHSTGWMIPENAPYPERKNAKSNN